MLTDSRDRVWIGFQGGGVAVHDRGTFQVFGERDGLAPGPVLGLLEDKQRRRVGGHGGRREPLPERPLHRRSPRPTRRSWTSCRCSSRTTKATSGWASTPASASSASTRAKWTGVAANPAYHIDTRCTTRPTACSRPRSPGRAAWAPCARADGRLWLTSGPGIAVIDPRRLPRSRRPPAPHIESIAADGRRAGARHGSHAAVAHRHAAHRVRDGEPVVGVEAALPLSARGLRRRLGVRGPAPRGHLRQPAVQPLPLPRQHDARRPVDRGRRLGLRAWRRRSTARAGS